MTHPLVELERKALELKNSGRSAEAAELFAMIVEQQPDWEHGIALHLLAQCYEDSGQLELGAKFYLVALEYGPENDIFLGGYASFLYLHGNPEEAFDAYVKLLNIYRQENSKDHADSCMLGINALGERLGWSRDMIAEKIANRTASESSSSTLHLA